MVNTEMVKNKLIKGLSVGGGVFASTFIGNAIDDFVPGGNTGTAVAQMAIGAGVAVGSERLGGAAASRAGVGSGMAAEVVEHVGYGVHGAGFAEAADLIQSGADTDQVVTVRARGNEQDQSSTEQLNAEVG